MPTTAPRNLAIVLAAMVLHASPAAAQTQIVIDFRMPDGTTFVETLRYEKKMLQGSSPPRTQVLESKGQYTVRKTPAGYSVYNRPIKPADLAVSDEVAAVSAGLITNVRVRYDVSRDGELMDIVGAEQAYVEMESALPAEARPLLRIAGITPVSFKQVLAMEWHLRDLFLVASHSGRPMMLGRQIENPDALLPSALAGAFKARSTLRSRGPVPCGKGRCVVIEASGASQDPNLGNLLTRTISGMFEGVLSQYAPAGAPMPKIPQLKVSQPQEKVRLERTIDTATGLYHSFVQSHDVTGSFSVPEQDPAGMPFRITVTRAYTYAY